jgi:hypothetical protein
MPGKLDAGIIKFAGANTPGWVSNIGMVLSSGELKLVQSDGTDFSSTAPGWVTLQSTTDGELISLKATATDHLFVDDAGSSDIVGEQFGVTTGVAGGNDE